MGPISLSEMSGIKRGLGPFDRATRHVGAREHRHREATTLHGTPPSARSRGAAAVPQGLISRIAERPESWVLLGMWGPNLSPERLHERAMLAAQTIKDLDKLPLIARKAMELAFLDPDEAERPYAAALRAGETLQGAIDRPRRLAHYEGEQGLATLSAGLMWAVNRQHALLDGNKRASVALAEEFLALNGHRFADDEDGLFDLTMAAAAKAMSEGQLAAVVARLIVGGKPDRPLAERLPGLMHRLATV